MRPIPIRALPHTVTLYNSISSGAYSAVILKNVYFEHCKKSNIDKIGAASADSVLLIIDYVNSKAFTRNGSPLSYLPAKEYQLKADKTPYWTLQDGAKDIFVLGVADEALDGNINAVKAGYAAYTVKVVDTYYYPGSTKIHHFEVSGA